MIILDAWNHERNYWPWQICLKQALLHKLTQSLYMNTISRFHISTDGADHLWLSRAPALRRSPRFIWQFVFHFICGWAVYYSLSFGMIVICGPPWDSCLALEQEMKHQGDRVAVWESFWPTRQVREEVWDSPGVAQEQQWDSSLKRFTSSKSRQGFSVLSLLMSDEASSFCLCPMLWF